MSDCGLSNTHLLVVVHAVYHVPYLCDGHTHHECTCTLRHEVTSWLAVLGTKKRDFDNFEIHVAPRKI